MHDEGPEDSSERYARQVIVPGIGRDGQARIARATVLIAGTGALGTHTAEYLWRAGVGRLRLVDRDLVEESNLARQIGFTEADARDRAPKALALARHLGAIRTGPGLEPYPTEIRAANAVELCEGADLIVDGTDNVPARFLLNDVSYRLGIPWIYGGVVRARGMVAAISGKNGPCLRCAFPDLPPPGALETCSTSGVLGPAVGLVAGQQGVLALRVLATGTTDGIAGRLWRWDAWSLEGSASGIRPDPGCPVCARGELEFLDGRGSSEIAVFCGRRAVQVRPVARRGVPSAMSDAAWRDLASRLARVATVDDRGVFLRAALADCSITLFRDGRAIFDGLTDEVRARSLYDLFIGE
jgi:adenylyltransferase/sulfurtransferase